MRYFLDFVGGFFIFILDFYLDIRGCSIARCVADFKRRDSSSRRFLRDRERPLCKCPFIDFATTGCPSWLERLAQRFSSVLTNLLCRGAGLRFKNMIMIYERI